VWNADFLKADVNELFAAYRCFSIYFSSRNPKKSHTAEELPPVHSKSNIKLDNTFCLSSIYSRCKQSTADRRLTDTLMVSPDTSTVYVEL